MDRDAVRALAGRDARQHLVSPGIDGEDGVRVLRSDIGAAAVGKEADAPWTRGDLDLGDLRALIEVDHLHRVAVLGADVHGAAVRAEDRVLRIFALHLHRERFALHPRVDEGDAVRLLACRRYPAPVGRAAHAFGRDAERDRTRGLAFLEVHQDQAVPRLIAHVEPAALRARGRAARLAAGLQRIDDAVGRRVDDADASRAFVRYIGERRR